MITPFPKIWRLKSLIIDKGRERSESIHSKSNYLFAANK